ncbi:MAG: DUF5689 domain-containing protein [Bacteroidia bacterium]|nr:DUF5689 domain-containing protein [Bacteroidia bacterium]
MKIYHYLLAIILFATTIVACERDYMAPPLSEPEYKGQSANITIAKLKSQYAAIKDPTLIDVDYILKAYVAGNDESGNIYKQLYIQDETGGINMGVDQNSMYTEFRVGQEVYVSLKGLYMVKYGDQLQIGYGNTNANRIPWETFNYYIFKNKWPNESNVVPKVIKLSELSDNLVNTLVQLDNVYFADGGKLNFSEPDATTNRTLKDGNGNSILVRNSNYATFANDLLPDGAGTIVGILSKFRSDWQFYIRTIDDVKNFGQPIPGGGDQGGGTPQPSGTIFSETFGTSLGNFTPHSVSGDQGWVFDSRNGAKMTGFANSANNANEDWLISPAINLGSVSTATLTFDHTINFAGTMPTEQTVWISSDYATGAPSSATWTQLTVPTYPTGKDWTFVSSGDIGIPAAFIGKSVRIAFKYISTASKASTWEIKNVLVTNKTAQGSGGNTPDPNPNPNPPTGTDLLNETFATNQGAFTIQDVTLPEGGSFVWKWDTFKYMKASAFIGGSGKVSESWLISPAMNMSTVSTATITFEHAINFAATMTNEQTLYISSNYSSGAPSTATWEKLTIPTYPTGKDWTFVSSGNISVPAAYIGKTNVKIAFKYTSTTSGAATWEVKNVIVK